MHSYTKTACLFATAVCLFSSGYLVAQEKEPKSTASIQSSVSSYVPSETTVAILPVNSASGGTAKAQNDRETTQADRELVTEFTKHGFKVVPSEQVLTAIQESKVDLSDEEQQKRETFYKMGKSLHADLIVFGMVTDTKQIEVDHFISTS